MSNITCTLSDIVGQIKSLPEEDRKFILDSFENVEFQSHPLQFLQKANYKYEFEERKREKAAILKKYLGSACLPITEHKKMQKLYVDEGNDNFGPFNEYAIEMMEDVPKPLYDDYAIDEKKSHEWVDAICIDEEKKAAQDLLATTTYVNWDTFTRVFKSILTSDPLFKELTERPWVPWIKVRRESPREKSNFWMSKLALELVPSLRKKVSHIWGKRLMEYIPFIQTFVIFDDAIYSGGQVANTVLDFLEEAAGFEPSTFKPIRLFIVVPYMTDNGYNYILDIIKEWFSKATNIEYVPLVKIDIIFGQKMKKLADLQPTGSNSAEIFGNFVPTYFSHKLADSVSSFPLPYSGYIPALKPPMTEEEMILNTQRLEKCPNRRRAQVIPYMHHCEDSHREAYKNIDTSKFYWKPDPYKASPLAPNVCPFPPYKKRK